MIPHWLNRAAYEKQVREEFFAYLHKHAQELRGSYDNVDGLLNIEDLRDGNDRKLNDAKLNPFKMYAAAASVRGRKAREAIYDFWVQQLQQMAADTGNEATLETHGDSVLPRLVDSEFISHIEKQTEVPQRAWGWTGLRVVYVFDRPDSVVYIVRNMAEDLGLNDVELHELALNNLRKIFDAAPIREALGLQKVSALNFEDGHGAARALLIGEHLEDHEACGVMLPDKNHLVIFPVPTDGNWAPVRELAAGMPDALLDRPLKITKRGIEMPI